MLVVGQNPQYFVNGGQTFPDDNTVTPQWAADEGLRGRMPFTVTSGFWEDELHTFHLSYGYRQQPDMGGALDYAYENYGLPLNDVCGPFMVARHPTMPIGARPLAYYQTAPDTSIGGLIPGQVISQPLLDPRNPAAGYDIYS